MRVVLGFSDSSRGGTSRSALLFADLWRASGAEVLVYSPDELHPDRAGAARRAGVVTTQSLSVLQEFEPHLVHLHHAAPSAATLDWLRAVNAKLPEDVVVLTHNIFGQPLPVDFGRRAIVGLLGDWVAAQYRLQSGAELGNLRIVPNPQDFSQFRPPSSDERRTAREELGLLPSERVILRVGSPSDEKWSLAGYRRLSATMDVGGTARVRLIGAPTSHQALANERTFVTHEPVDDDSLLLEYWAADVFAHWADRGESFGNVILEAMGTGLPVAYRAVRTRDNTPFEFRGLPSFHYTTSTKSWLKVVETVHTGDRSAPDGLAPFAAPTLVAQLTRIVGSGPAGADAVYRTCLEAFATPSPIGRANLVRVAMRHNPIAAIVKRLRLQRSGR
jgi:glycosyltransferase involved in cell wall biosynthesis